jgi:ABC-type uncharacterized transport system permease subunit
MQLEANVSQKVILIIQAVIIFMIGAESIVKWAFERFAPRKVVAA